jgi:hypothetical protein
LVFIVIFFAFSLALIHSLPLIKLPLNVLLQRHSCHLYDFSVDYFVWQLSKLYYSRYLFAIEKVEQQSFPPEILEKVMLLEYRVVHHEEIKVVMFPAVNIIIIISRFLLNAISLFCFGPIGIIEVIKIHEILLIISKHLLNFIQCFQFGTADLCVEVVNFSLLLNAFAFCFFNLSKLFNEVDFTLIVSVFVGALA